MMTLTCYGEPYATVDDRDVLATAHEHIKTCPKGAMPWADKIEWHRADQLGHIWVAAAGGEWLNHSIEAEKAA